MEGDLETISLGILYTSFTVSSLFASSVVTKLGSKNALLLGTTAKRGYKTSFNLFTQGCVCLETYGWYELNVS
nr:UNC93-like protein 3 [Tanacetum cinerariifolium]